MSAYNEIINGKGLPNFAWEVARYIGNDETETIGYYDTYLEALIFKLRHKTPEKLVIDLWDYNTNNTNNTQPQFLGSNFLEIKTQLETLT